MNIAIPVTGNDLNSNVDMRFGRTTGFLLVDNSNNKVSYTQNPGYSQPGGAGIATAQFLAEQNTDAIICGNIGPNAYDALKAGNIRIFQINTPMTAQQALDQFEKGNLPEVTGPTGPSHVGMGRRGQGRGRGGGRGRRQS